MTAIACFALVAALSSCTDENANGACTWLFAPTSFVDAGEPGCTAEPSGQTCDASNGRCQNVCQPGEYRLTCRTSETSRFVIPEETITDPVVGTNRNGKCNPIRVDDDGLGARTEYCCRCERE